MKAYDALYRETGRYGDPCSYCGQVADTLDHIPPLLRVEMLTAAGQECDGPYVKVPACIECNSALTSLNKMTLKERRAHVRGYLRKKYKKFLKIPNWDEDELAEVDPAFAKEIRASVNFANHVRARLAWMR